MDIQRRRLSLHILRELIKALLFQLRPLRAGQRCRGGLSRAIWCRTSEVRECRSPKGRLLPTTVQWRGFDRGDVIRLVERRSEGFHLYRRVRLGELAMCDSCHAIGRNCTVLRRQAVVSNLQHSADLELPLVFWVSLAVVSQPLKIRESGREDTPFLRTQQGRNQESDRKQDEQ